MGTPPHVVRDVLPRSPITQSSSPAPSGTWSSGDRQASKCRSGSTPPSSPRARSSRATRDAACSSGSSFAERDASSKNVSI